MTARFSLAIVLAALAGTLGCSESAGGPEYASLSVQVENAAGAVTERYCGVLPVLPGGRLEQELRVQDAFVITLSGTRDEIAVTFRGIVDPASAERSFTHAELRTQTNDAYTVSTPRGDEYVVVLTAPCPVNP